MQFTTLLSSDIRMDSKKEWFVLFSQTGSEIYHLSKKLGRFPDKIITNKPLADVEKIHAGLFGGFTGTWIFLPKKPTVAEYQYALASHTVDPVVTLHGYLRIIPSEICTGCEMYNGHPGDIITYPELKGFNPQEKAFNLQHQTAGSVIHKVIPEVDAGSIVMSKTIDIKRLTLDQVYRELHSNSIELWYNFLKEKL